MPVTGTAAFSPAQPSFPRGRALLLLSTPSSPLGVLCALSSFLGAIGLRQPQHLLLNWNWNPRCEDDLTFSLICLGSPWSTGCSFSDPCPEASLPQASRHSTLAPAARGMRHSSPLPASISLSASSEEAPHDSSESPGGLQEVPEVTLGHFSSLLLWNVLHKRTLYFSDSEMSLLKF